MSAQTPSGDAGGGGAADVVRIPSKTEAPATTVTAPAAEKTSRKRPYSRFISWICCAGSDKDNEQDADGPRISSKKSSQAQSVAGRKEAVPGKVGGDVPEESATEPKATKHGVDEAAGDPEKTQVVGADAPQRLPPQPAQQASTSAPVLSEKTEPVETDGDAARGQELVVVVGPEQKQPQQQRPQHERQQLPLPPGLSPPPPDSPTPSQRGASGAGAEPLTQPQKSELMVVVQAPTPVVAQSDPVPSPAASTAPTTAVASPDDDDDIDMLDALSSPATSQGPPEPPTPDDEMPDAVGLPGPPPLQHGAAVAAPAPSQHAQSHVRQGSERSRASDRPSTGEPQPWLLPPREARFGDRKCLVLDLDETLVHSSFKVGVQSSSRPRWSHACGRSDEHACRSSTRPISPSPSRSKASTTTSTSSSGRASTSS